MWYRLLLKVNLACQLWLSIAEMDIVSTQPEPTSTNSSAHNRNGSILENADYGIFGLSEGNKGGCTTHGIHTNTTHGLSNQPNG